MLPHLCLARPRVASRDRYLQCSAAKPSRKSQMRSLLASYCLSATEESRISQSEIRWGDRVSEYSSYERLLPVLLVASSVALGTLLAEIEGREFQSFGRADLPKVSETSSLVPKMERSNSGIQI